MLTRFYLPIARQTRQMSTRQKVKLSVTMDEETYKKIDNEELKPRKHPGKMIATTVQLPDWLFVAVKKALIDTPMSALILDSEKLANYLNGRHPPAEESVVKAKYTEIAMKVASQRKAQSEDVQSLADLEAKEKKRSAFILKQIIHSWSPIQYNRYASLLYLVARSAQEYAVLYKIFHEISTRDKDFQPKTLLDFGSGVGTVALVTSHLWPTSVREHMCVDVSTEMNDLSELIIGHADPKIKKVFYRQFIPLSNRTYDIVVSAYSLLELPTMKTRLETIAKLWARTERYLVIVEQGTNAGFKMINEARDFILHMQRAQNETELQPNCVFSPCPHDLPCPRYKTDNTPCNFEVAYNPLRLKNIARPGIERFSYVVLKKGESSADTKNWPRIVRPTLVRSKHAICRMCTADGRLNEIIFTATKHGKWMYRCAKASKWGDRLPIETAIDSTKEEKKDVEGKIKIEDEGEEEEEDDEKETENEEEKQCEVAEEEIREKNEHDK